MEFALPHIGEGIQEAELVRWLVQPGDSVKPGQSLLEVVTDKATMEVPAPFAGRINALQAEVGQKIQIGQVLLDYTPAGQDGPDRETTRPSTASLPTEAIATPRYHSEKGSAVLRPTPLSVRAAPSVRHMARKLGVDLTTVPGSGPDGRILLDDLMRFVRPPAATEPPAARTAIPSLDVGTPGTRKPLIGLRRSVAERMVLSKKTIPHYSYIDECDVTELVRLRAALKDTYGKAGIKLTYLAFLVKAVVAALQEVPLVNASLDEERREIVLHDQYHIGVAVAVPGGLLVPVVRDADKKDLGTIAREVDSLSQEARAGKAKPEQLKGSTFTITSVGNLGGLISTPVINYPEVGILGIGKIVRRPVYDEAGQIRPADLLYLSFSFDHRVVDGAIGALFGNAVIKRLQNPATLLLPNKL